MRLASSSSRARRIQARPRVSSSHSSSASTPPRGVHRHREKSRIYAYSERGGREGGERVPRRAAGGGAALVSLIALGERTAAADEGNDDDANRAQELNKRISKLNNAPDLFPTFARKEYEVAELRHTQ